MDHMYDDISSSTISAQLSAKSFARKTTSRSEPASHEKPSLPGKIHGEGRRATHFQVVLFWLWRRNGKTATTAAMVPRLTRRSSCQRCSIPPHTKRSRFRMAPRVVSRLGSRSLQHSRPQRSIDIQSRETPGGEEALEIVLAVPPELRLPRLEQLHCTEKLRSFLVAQNA